MVIVQINATSGRGSTGKICLEISRLLTEQGVENYILYSMGDTAHPASIRCAGPGYIRLQALKARIFGNYGFNSIRETKKIIAWLEKLKPDIVHLHNIHGHDCSLELLLGYLADRKIRVIWTFHDCWAFTGYCTHFAGAQCGKWKTGCGGCPQRKQYSWFFDRSAQLYRRKKELLSRLDLTVVTPSRWLAEQVRASFLKDCPLKVIPNGIDLTVFRPTAGDFRQRYGIADGQKIILGVSYIWNDRKGLDVFVRLARELPADRFRVVLVGTDPAAEKDLPREILAIPRTRSPEALAGIYSAADVLLNPTREDTFPTVNLEALACGTPVVTFDTGGSPEALDGRCGSVIAGQDIDAICAEVRRVCMDAPYRREDCVRRGQQFDRKALFQKYVDFYGECCHE